MGGKPRRKKISRSEVEAALDAAFDHVIGNPAIAQPRFANGLFRATNARRRAVAMRREGALYKEIMHETGLSYDTIRRACEDAGVKGRRGGFGGP